VKIAFLINTVSQTLNLAVEKILLLIGIAIGIILFAQVIFRYLGASLGWSEEVSRHLLVAITFLGGTSAYKRASFIGLSGIGGRLGQAARVFILRLLQALTLSCFGVIAWFGIEYTIKASEQTTSSLQIPMSIPFAVIPLSSIILAIHVLADMTNPARRSPT
jgi:TRAP-type C4-dicarboxylate transport system permease small subunit